MILARVFVPFACGYFLSYLYRVINAVIAPDLMAELRLDAAELGFLTSAYFLTFALFQLPLGMLLDRFGPRRTEAALLMFAALGAFVFATASGIGGLVAGRALIGFGVSACLMAAFKAFRMFFAVGKLPLISGFQMAIGGLGALSGTVPVEAALGVTDWRGVFITLGIVTIAVGFVIFLVAPEKEGEEADAASFGELLGGIGAIFRSFTFWRIAPLTVASQSTFLSIQSLWAGPWLRDAAGLGRDAVAFHLLAIAGAMIAGFLLLGAASERLARRGVPPIVMVIGCSAVFMVILSAIIGAGTGAPLILWMAFGFFGTSGILPYSLLSQSFPAHLAGRVITGLNFLVFAGAFGAQWGIGAVINLWPPSAGGAYPLVAYDVAFSLMLALQALALTWFAFATLGFGKSSE